MMNKPEIKIPSKIEDLKDFIGFCKDFSKFEDYVTQQKKELDEVSEKMYSYGRRILQERFIKSEEDWLKVLSDKDAKEMLRKKIYMNFKNQYYIRCGVTGKFYNAQFYDKSYSNNFDGIKNLNKLEFEISEHFILIEQMWYGRTREARCYADGYTSIVIRNFTINLIDYSVKVSEVTERTTIRWSK